MLRRQMVPLALLVIFGVACSDAAPGPTEAVPDGRLLTHAPSHPGEPLYELTLIPVEGSGFATLATDCDDRGHLVADEWDQSLRAGGAGKVGVEEDRFQLRFTPDADSGNLFGGDPLCLGNVRPEGDWRDDLIIWYDRARGRHPASVSLQWYFTHGEGEQERRYRLNGGSTTDLIWNQITGGTTVHVDGSYTLQDITLERDWPTVAEGQFEVAFTATLLEDGGDGNGGDDGECRPHPVHDRCR